MRQLAGRLPYCTSGSEGGVEKRTVKTQENIEWPNGGSVTSLGRQRALLLPYHVEQLRNAYAEWNRTKAQSAET
jgi:hypothetical protein